MLVVFECPSDGPSSFAEVLSLIRHRLIPLPRTQLSTLNSTTVISLKGLIPPFRFLLPAGPARTMLQPSARDRYGLLKL